MRRAVLALVAPAIVAVAACSDGPLAPPQGLPNALARHVCAPNDGAATQIILTPLPFTQGVVQSPSVSVAIFTAPDRSIGTWSIAPGSTVGFAALQTSADNWENSARGSVTVSAISADSTISGKVDVTFPSSGRIVGSFSAQLMPRTFTCP